VSRLLAGDDAASVCTRGRSPLLLFGVLGFEITWLICDWGCPDFGNGILDDHPHDNTLK
jgi:hypothetical protein